MNTVRARVWRFKIETGPKGAEAVVATEIGQGPLPVTLSALVHINALACDLRKVVDRRVRDHEIALLASYITSAPTGGPLAVDCSALDSSSGHIRRFVSESTGLGVMTAASEALFDWKAGSGGLSSFDVLPAHLASIYGGAGVRPDLLFDLAERPVAGEARGRRRDAKVMFPAVKGTADQKARLQKLAKWSVDHGDHAYFMSWVWLGSGGVYVDIFLPLDDPATAGIATDWIEKRGSTKEWRFRVPRPEPRRNRSRAETDQQMDVLKEEPNGLQDRGMEQAAPVGFASSHVDELPRTPTALGHGVEPVDMVSRMRQANEAVDAAMDRVYGHSTATAGKLAGVPVRGEWILADALGPARYEVLVGVLAERLPFAARTERRRRGPWAPGRLDTLLEGRLLTVVRPARDSRPPWDRIAAEVLEGP